MSTSDYILYTLWILVPIFYFMVILWSKLESLSSSKPPEDFVNYTRQGVITGCIVIVCIFIDRAILPGLVKAIFGEALPLMFFRIMLLPAVLYLTAKLLGPSKKPEVEEVRTIQGGRHKRR